MHAEATFVVEAKNTMEVRPRLPHRFTAVLFAIGAVILVLLVILPLQVVDMPYSWAVDIPIVAFVGAGVVAGILYLANQRVGISGGDLYRVSALRRRRTWPISDLHYVVRVRAQLGLLAGGLQPAVPSDVVVDKKGIAVASFTGAWDQQALRNLWTAAGLVVYEPWTMAAPVQEIRWRFPGAVPVMPLSGGRSITGREGLVIGAMFAGAIVLAAVVFIVLVVGTALRQA